ncbi:ATP-binding protein [Sandaracinus amylolyticus]|uniref:histidine kinase n=1 Tax=Sandaracinus amylolyticus TaxID=927083 RepID=A0A0F6W0A2_9BACT|nr:ATP-binding protein [Sandaracinus amylolyticus]AKF04002.1 Two-component hybrid sensor and regulator [Sandaracinus amylolyticus]
MHDALHIPTLAACFGESAEAVWVIRREGRPWFANAAAERSASIGGAALAASLERARALVVERGESARVEVDTGVVRVMRASPVRDAEGRVVAVTIVATVRDTTRAPSPVERERARLQRIIDHAPALVAILRGPDHVYELINERFKQTIPEAGSLIGTSARAHRTDLVAQQFVARLDHVHKTGEAYESVEVPRVVEREDGPETIYLTFVFQPILRESDRSMVDGVVTFAFDVTESVLARKQVEETSRAKDEFLSTLSHELRTPLNAIVGWSHLLRTGALQGTQMQRALEAIDRNAKVQKRLIDDLLDFSRMVSGKLGVNDGVVDLAELVTTAVDSIRPAAEAKRLQLSTRLEARPLVSGDPDRLHQVIANLLSNATKFTGPRGRVEVVVRATEDRAELEVRDDGVGIDPSLLPHVFERYRQADGSTTRRHGGLGLGLAIARAIVEMHGGRIDAWSEGIGRGTIMRVSLPWSLEPERDEPASVGVRLAAGVPRLAGVRVLVVDDEIDACVLAETVLRRAGAEVRSTSTASRALDLLHEGEVDVLVSDLGMPELDGFTLIQRVRAMPSPACRVPAVALTGYARAEDRVRAVDAGYDAFLTKPLDVDALALAVARAAGRVAE